MEHVFFFSYASVNIDDDLEAFIDDLRAEVAPGTPFAKSDPQVSFRDRSNLKLMDKMDATLVGALQGSSVLVCVTSPGYFNSRYCGQEYQLFDQRRRQGVAPGAAVPDVILPLIWYPVPGNPLLSIQLQPANVTEEAKQIYKTYGLRYLKKRDPEAYIQYVQEFGLAIVGAWQQVQQAPIPPLAGVESFDNIPNRFAGGQWEEAAGPNGWLAGSGIVNFVFTAGSTRTPAFPHPQRLPGRYGQKAADWRPYLPPQPATVEEIAYAAAKRHSLKYREIVIDANLTAELAAAKGRKNLTVVVADPLSLTTNVGQSIAPFDQMVWKGSALLLPLDTQGGAWEPPISASAAATFPILTQMKAPAFQAPIPTAKALEEGLDVALSGLRAAVTDEVAAALDKTDKPPSQISAA